MNRWIVTDEIRDKFKPILKEYFDKVENLTVEQAEKMSNEDLGIDLSDKGINPSQLVDLLEEFGYKEDDRDDNGWELDFWIYMRRHDGETLNSPCDKLVIIGCGMTFELKIRVDKRDY